MNCKNKKCLILGSTSFAGSCFIDKALKAGFEVVGISRSENKNPVFLPYEPRQRFLKTYVFDLNHNQDEIINVIGQFKPEYIIDFAGQGMVAPSWEMPEQWYRTNILSKVTLIRLLREAGFLKKYIRISTPEVYGSKNYAVKEASQFNPSTPYAISHATIDQHMMSYFREFGFPVVIGRFSNFYGSYQQLYRLVPKAFLMAFLGKTFFLEGDGNSVRSFLHSFDFCNGILAMIDKGRPGKTYHFSTDEFVYIKTVVEMIAEITGCKFNDFVKFAEDRRGKDLVYKMCTEMTREQLDWAPGIELYQGLCKTAAWIEVNIDQLMKQPLNYNHKE